MLGFGKLAMAIGKIFLSKDHDGKKNKKSAFRIVSREKRLETILKLLVHFFRKIVIKLFIMKLA